VSRSHPSSDGLSAGGGIQLCVPVGGVVDVGWVAHDGAAAWSSTATDTNIVTSSAGAIRSEIGPTECDAPHNPVLDPDSVIFLCSATLVAGAPLLTLGHCARLQPGLDGQIIRKSVSQFI
jgi:hypothetical protein